MTIPQYRTICQTDPVSFLAPQFPQRGVLLGYSSSCLDGNNVLRGWARIGEVPCHTVQLKPVLDCVWRPILVINLLTRRTLYNPHWGMGKIHFYWGFFVQLCSTSALVSESENQGYYFFQILTSRGRGTPLCLKSIWELLDCTRLLLTIYKASSHQRQ